MPNRVVIRLFVLCSIVFLITSLLSVNNLTSPFDQTIIQWSETISTPFLMQLMSFVTFIGSGEFIFLMMLCLLGFFLYKKNWYQSIFIVWLTVSGVFLNFILKLLFQRERPGEISYIEVFGYSLEIASYSFPSGHTMRTVLMFLLLIYLTSLYVNKATMRITLYTLYTLVIVAVFF
ncbi:MAG: phosphatase PAP2 family protein [Bacillus sp. (in: Bacteria)]|nr:phosphatase PAP2 family protein [Bacillus sp. (in: firmicutes)]